MSQYDAGDGPPTAALDHMLPTSHANGQPPAKRARTTSARDSSATAMSTPAGSASGSRSHTPASRGFLNPFPQGDLAGAINALNRGGGIAGKGGATSSTSRLGNGTTGNATRGGFARMAGLGAHAAGGTGLGTGTVEGGRSEQSGGSALSSKAISDQFVVVRTQMDTLKEQLKDVTVAHDGTIGRLTENMNVVTNEVDELAAEVEGHGERVAVVEGALRVALERLALAEGRLEELTHADGANSAPTGALPEKLSAKSKNALQGAVRECLKGFMEITDSEGLPQPLANGQYWEATTMLDPKTGTEVPSRRLRPQWDKPWADNETAWLLDVIHRVRVNGKEYTSHDFGAVTQEHMKKAIESVWKTFTKKWNTQNASDEKKQGQALLAKKKQRKMNKAKGRQAMVAKGIVPRLREERYAHLLQWQYMSTDESEEETVDGVIDPHSDDEQGGITGTLVARKRMTRKVWVSRPAAYMPDESTALLREVDAHIDLDRSKKEKEVKGAMHIPRCQGKRREYSELPSLHGATKNRRLIPRSMVCPQWLLTETGREQDSSMFMVMDCGEDVEADERAQTEEGQNEEEQNGEGHHDE